MKEWLKKYSFELLFGYCVGLAFIVHCFKHLSFNTHAFDVAFIHQPLFYPLTNGFLHCSLCNNQTYFGEHLSYIFYFLAPVTSLLKSDFFIFSLQTFFLAFPIYFIIKNLFKDFKQRYWILAFVLIFLHKSFRHTFLWDFREDAMAFFFLSLSLYFLILKSHSKFILLLFLTYLCKENYAFIGFPLILVVLLDSESKNKTKLAMTICLLSLVMILINFKIAFPYFQSGIEKQNVLVARLGAFGQTPNEILVNLLTKPSSWWTILSEYLFEKSRMKYTLTLLIPGMYFFIKSPLWLIPAAAGIFMNLLSSTNEQRMMIFHYDLIIWPFLIISLVLGLKKRLEENRIHRLGLAFTLVATLLVSGQWNEYKLFTYWPDQEQVSDFKFLHGLSCKDVIAADLKTLAHINHCSEFRILNDESNVFVEFKEKNSIPDYRSKLKTTDAKMILLNKNVSNQQILYTELIKNGWKEHSASSSYTLLVGTF